MSPSKIREGLIAVAAGLLLGVATGAFAAEVITIRIAYGNNIGEPTDTAAREWGRLMKEKSRGRVEFEYYPSSLLGSQRNVTEELTKGANIISINDGGFLMDYVPGFGITAMPYLFDSPNDLYKLVDSELFKDLVKQLDSKGLYVVHSKWVYGVRNTILDRPATRPNGLRGMKIRAPNNRISIEVISAMGAKPIPLPLAETYPALAEGEINGAENPIPVIYGSKLHERAKFLLLTRHQITLATWVAGTRFIRTLPRDIVRLLKETGEQAGRLNDEENAATEREVIRKMEAAGVKVIEVDRAAFKAATKDFPSRFWREFPPEFMERVYAAIGHR